MKTISIIATIIFLCGCAKFLYKEPYTLVLKHPCHFIDHPGRNVLMPVGSHYLLPQDKKYILGDIPIGTQIKHLGAYREKGYMMTKTNHYARILSGKFKGKKVSFDYVMREKEEGKVMYEYLDEK
jgi:hypothetical protein